MMAPALSLLDQLRLHHAAAVLPTWLDCAAHEELSYADFLQGVLEEEVTARAHADVQRRLRQADFPFAATIEQFDFRFRPELKRQVVLRYLDPTFVEQAGALTLIGPPGLGKTMLAVCVATKLVQKLGETQDSAVLICRG
jgi:DNA replication protein DnaC